MKCVSLKISGKVQGVFYRQSAKSEAIALGINGWIRNNPDGSVEALVAGNEKSLEQFIKWAKRGPLMAKVEKVDIKEQISEANLASFEIIG